MKKTCLSILFFAIALRLAIMAFTPLRDPSESRYAVMAKNMSLTDNFLVPHFYHEGEYQSFDGKPPLFFQAAGLVVEVLGPTEFAVRLPSFLAALGIVAMVFALVRKLRGSSTAWLTAMLTGTSLLFYIFSGISLTDMVLTLCICGALFSYAFFCASERRRYKTVASLALFFWLGAGMLAKGPVAIVMAGIPIFLFIVINKRWKEVSKHSWILGPLLFLLVAAPWYILIERQNPGFLKYFFIQENFQRFLSSTPQGYGDKYGSGHIFPKGMALIWFVAANTPWLVLLGLMLPKFRKGTFPRLWSRALWDDVLTGMALCTAIGITLFWCLSNVALVYYLLPTTPFVCAFVADLLTRDGWVDQRRFMRWLVPVAYLMPIGATIGLLLSTFFGVYTTARCPGILFKELRSNPELAESRFYFAGGKPPYSAEFYLGNRVHQNIAETLEESLEASKHDILLVRKKQIPKEGIIPRRLITQKGHWFVYAPEKH